MSFQILDQIYLFPQRWQQNWKLESFHLNDDQVSFQKTLPNLFISTDATLELKIGKLSPEWRPSVFSKYSIKFIYFHKGDKRTENWKAFTWMATKCLFKILDQIYLFLQRSLKNWKLEGFHLAGNQVYFQNTLLNLFISTKVTKELKIRKLSLNQMSFQNTLPNLFISTDAT